MSKTLLQGKPYVPSHATNVSATFARVRREQKEAEEARVRDSDEAKSKTILLPERRRA